MVNVIFISEVEINIQTNFKQLTVISILFRFILRNISLTSIYVISFGTDPCILNIVE